MFTILRLRLYFALVVGLLFILFLNNSCTQEMHNFDCASDLCVSGTPRTNYY
uniref:Uncharacterized protein n=1 Tax=Arundo donax TaxID=35708 RepID=A0A0A9ANT3_ARUDO